MENNKSVLEKLNVKKINNSINLGNKILKILYILLIISLIYIISLLAEKLDILGILIAILSAISPLFIGLVVAWLLNPLVNKLVEKNLKRTTAVVLVYFLLIVFLYFFSLAIIPGLVTQVNDMVTSMPDILKNIIAWIDNIFTSISDRSLVNLDNVKTEFYSYLETFGTNLMTDLPKMLISFISSLVSGIGTIVISFIIGFYMLLNFNTLFDKFIKFLPRKMRKNTTLIIDLFNKSLLEYIKGNLLSSLIIFITNYIGFLIIGLKAPLLFALFCAITNLIPYIGPYIGGAAAVLVGLTQSTLIGLLVLVFIAVVQGIEGNILTPFIMSRKLNLHPVVIIVSLLVFGHFFGILGMLLATPICALIKILFVFFDEKYGIFDYQDDYLTKTEKK